MLIYEKVGEMGSLANQKHCGHQLSPVVIKLSQLPLRQNEKLKINFLFFYTPSSRDQVAILSSEFS